MNYLAHIYLSGDDPEHQIGGFIGDFVKGDFQGKYTPKIEEGIALHRKIDKISDFIPSFVRSRSRVSPEFSRFSGIFIDIYYDHFLAKNWSTFHQQSLEEFSHHFMNLIHDFERHIPEHAYGFIQYMRMNELFDYYEKIENIDRVFYGMSRRFKRKNPLSQGITDLKNHYEKFENDFFQFMKEIKKAIDG